MKAKLKNPMTEKPLNLDVFEHELPNIYIKHYNSMKT